MKTKRTANRLLLGLMVSVFLASSGVSAQEENAAEHEKLRVLRDAFTAAMNAQDFAALKGLVTDDLSFTTISNEQISGVAELETYWKRLFDGEDSEMSGLKVTPEADALTTFLGADAGIVQGSSQDVYSFRKVGERKMTSRWTALVRKVGGEWKVSHVHMSGNVLDNPVLAATATVGTIKTVIGFVAGLLIGALLLGRSRRKKA